MVLADHKLVPKAIRKESVLVQLAAAYFHIARRMEQKAGSQTRRFVLATLGGGATQNQIATLLGLDRTVVHRTSLTREGLVFSGGGLWVLETPWFESESQLIC